MRWIGLAGCLSLLVASGCGGGTSGPSYANVSGIVTLDDKPIEGATVTFSPKGEGSMSLGLTDAAGKFTLKTATGKNGAAVGEHSVAISLFVDLGGEKPKVPDDGLAPPTEAELGGAAGPAAPKNTTRWIIPERYSDPVKSGLSVTVPPGGLTDHKFELKSK